MPDKQYRVIVNDLQMQNTMFLELFYDILHFANDRNFGKVKWVDFINKHQMYDWINAWNPYDYKYKIQYDVRTTPQIFILDKDKKIIGKRIGHDQVFDLIEAYKAHHKE